MVAEKLQKENENVLIWHCPSRLVTKLFTFGAVASAVVILASVYLTSVLPLHL